MERCESYVGRNANDGEDRCRSGRDECSLRFSNLRGSLASDTVGISRSRKIQYSCNICYSDDFRQSHAIWHFLLYKNIRYSCNFWPRQMSNG